MTILFPYFSDLTLGLIDLAFPDKMKQRTDRPESVRKAEEAAWGAIYEQLIATLQTVHRKNSRVSFLPDGFWTDHGREVGIIVKLNILFLILGHGQP